MPDFWHPDRLDGSGTVDGDLSGPVSPYLHGRGLADTAPRKVRVLCGDGEMDEPDRSAPISLAGREKLDHLIFVYD